jgi:hypothetical protein
MTEIRKLIYLSEHGLQHRSEDGAIANLGGIFNPAGTFTVNGKGLLFDDGTSTVGGPGHGGGGTLQSVYENSTDSHGNASITLATSKDFAIYDDTNNSIYFKITSTTGAVTITGDLTVLGSTFFQNVTEVSDHWAIKTSAPSTIALSIEPSAGVTPTADLLNIKKLNGGSSVVRVDATGKLIASTAQVNNNLTVIGLINGIDIVALNNSVSDHLAPTYTNKHFAAQIQVIPTIPTLPGVTNVQQALQGLATQIANISIGSAAAIGYEHIQAVAASVWTVSHPHHTTKVQFTAYNETDDWILPNSFKIVDDYTVRLSFGQPQAGKVVLMMF